MITFDLEWLLPLADRPPPKMTEKNVLGAYQRWTRSIIENATAAHQASLGAVLKLDDDHMLNLYDKILGMLAGPQTVRLRMNPGLLTAWRAHRAQRAFALALYHQEKVKALAN